MSVKFANNAHSTLASSVSTSATSITVASGHGARFPSLSGSEFFYATLIDTSNNLEIVKVTARSTDVLTATRAQESTSARAFASGDRIELRVTAQGLVDNISNLDAANLVSGTIPDARFPATLPALSGANLTGIDAAGRLIGVEVLGPYATISGSGNAAAQFDQRTGATGTWTRPAGCNSVLVYVTGGGGGARSDDSSYRGGAGGGGGTAIKFITSVASSVSWTVGAGGTGVRGSEGGTPNNGGTSSFASYCSGFGGEGGQGGAGGQYGASGGGATGGDLNIPGGGGVFNHNTAQDVHGGMSFWTQAGSQHTNTTNHTTHGKMGSGGGGGQSPNNVDRLHGGAGVIMVYEYS